MCSKRGLNAGWILADKTARAGTFKSCRNPGVAHRRLLRQKIIGEGAEPLLLREASDKQPGASEPGWTAPQVGSSGRYPWPRVTAASFVCGLAFLSFSEFSSEVDFPSM